METAANERRESNGHEAFMHDIVHIESETHTVKSNRMDLESKNKSVIGTMFCKLTADLRGQPLSHCRGQEGSCSLFRAIVTADNCVRSLCSRGPTRTYADFETPASKSPACLR